MTNIDLPAAISGATGPGNSSCQTPSPIALLLHTRNDIALRLSGFGLSMPASAWWCLMDIDLTHNPDPQRPTPPPCRIVGWRINRWLSVEAVEVANG